MLKYREQIKKLFRHVCMQCERTGLLYAEDLAKTIPLGFETQTG